MQKIINRPAPTVILFLVLNSFLSSCKGQTQKLECYAESLKDLQEQPVYHMARNTLQDTIQSWMERRLKGVRFLKQIEWKIDEAVFFNATYSKAILLILERDTLQLVKVGDIQKPPTQDDIKMIFACLENNQWQFYYQSMPTMVVLRKEYNKTSPMTFDELSEIGRRDVLNGYFKTNSCNVSEEYFERWNVVQLKIQQEKFLNNDAGLYGYMKDEE